MFSGNNTGEFSLSINTGTTRKREVFSSRELISMLQDTRKRTLELQADLSDEQLKTPLLSIINPPVWELGHVAWFQEKWALRHLCGLPSIRKDADQLWDSAAVAHDTRWDLSLPSRKETLRYMQDVLDCVLEGLERQEATDQQAYFHWLAVMHEDMHGEAFTYTRHTLSYPAPWPNDAVVPPAASTSEEKPFRDIEIPEGAFLLGAERGEEFVFDNEKWCHPVDVGRFLIARTPVTNGEFTDFVNDGGYRQRRHWSDSGWFWKEGAAAQHPLYWTPDSSGKWLQRHFNQIIPLEKDVALIHVNWHEAQAYCRWAGRRLPTEAEWEKAASAEPAPLGACSQTKRRFPWGDRPPSPELAPLDANWIGCSPVSACKQGESAFGCRQMIGNVWEWTADAFQPYPGFVADPYKEYSEPWFGGDYKVLRGGCWATRSRLIRNTWRNFYTMDRRDVFAGFRTCAL
jgi:iron(II)-dependent oxidoreductase